ncbi:MAG: helix-turn-helix transcriptional regulator [Bdellovibrionaceae bacterium]|nr:helix-turn-helix transcriptional regulator [Pseudobdellovibrionaceae bacterium]
MNTVKTVAGMIKTARERKGLTQKEVGRLLGYQNGQFIYMIENGSKIPLNALGKLIVLLGMDEQTVMSTLVKDYARTAKSALKNARAAL